MVNGKGRMASTITEYEARDQFRDLIDELTPAITILGYSYSASTVLEEVDPIAFRTSMLDWADSMDMVVE